MNTIRWILGRIILLIDFITRPALPKRTAEQQTEIDMRTAHLALYQLTACPFCVKVRRAMRRQGLNIELRNIKSHDIHKQELLANGGKTKVPCLRVDRADGEIQWLYESSNIVKYLEQFA